MEILVKIRGGELQICYKFTNLRICYESVLEPEYL